MSETVRVRAAVAMLPDGRYVVSGWSEGWGSQGAPSDEALIEGALDYLYSCCEEEHELNHHAVHFVEAPVPKPVKPEPLTVEGEVVAEGESAGGEP